MSLSSRIANLFRGRDLSREIDEELQSHIDEAIAEGRDPREARGAFGSMPWLREESRAIKLLPWIDSLRADAVFGWRQLMKTKVTTAAAALSLALATGACTTAFRLIDALLLRPLPVANPSELRTLSRQGIGPDGKPASFDGWAYPAFQRMRAAVRGQAELVAVSYAERLDLTYRSDQELEKAWVQYVSGWMFGTFGLQPSLGRLLSESDDLKPRAHPYAVISYDYWTRRLSRDPKAIGRTFRLGDDLYEIVGVGPETFTGTEPGTVTDVFVPTMMHPAVLHDDWIWHRTLARLKPGADAEQVRTRLNAISQAFERERLAGLTGLSKQEIAAILAITLVLEPAAAGASGLQSDYRVSLIALGVLVALVLLIACANVANLMTAQAAARAREMALRVSIGAGRWRLVQLALVESAILTLLAAATGTLFAWWSAPFVIGMINPPDNPARLTLPVDWRLLGFALALTFLVMLMLGLLPAWRASTVKPVTAIKGGDDPHARRRLTHGLIAVQVALCFVILFVAGLFVATFERLSSRPTGFVADRLITLDTVAKPPQTAAVWEQVAEHLGAMPGVERVAIASSPLLAGASWNNSISVRGAPPNGVLTYLLKASPGWIGTLKIPLIAGRDFRPSDAYPGAAIVNETFVKTYFNGENPVGMPFEVVFSGGHRIRCETVGVVGDVTYRNVREPILPQAYFPFSSVDAKGAPEASREGTIDVRTSIANPLALATMLRQAVSRAQPQFRVINVRMQADLVRAQMLRERLLALLAVFFGVVALLLAAVGLYGVLEYSVLQRKHEIGIRIALGAQSAEVARRVTVGVFSMVAVGAAAGLGLSIASVRFVETLLYQVRGNDLRMLLLPALIVALSALLSAIPAVIRAVRTDPVAMLRAE